MIYTKYCCVQSFMQNKTSLGYFMRESAKKAKKSLKSKLTKYYEEYDYDLHF